jgi:ABC-type sugar transport system ATPase subunit
MGSNSLHVLKGINFSVAEGELVSIMGSSGSKWNFRELQDLFGSRSNPLKPLKITSLIFCVTTS